MFLIVDTPFNIEHNYRARERSFNSTSTVDAVDVGSTLNSSCYHQLSSPRQLVASCLNQPHRAPPLSTGMWAGSTLLSVDEGIWEGETAGGTQDVGGPPSALRTRGTTFVVPRFSLYLYSSHRR
jgi:hypothetical protein